MHHGCIGIIGVNGTGKTTLLDVVSERIGFDGDVSPFTKANGYKIALFNSGA